MAGSSVNTPALASPSKSLCLLAKRVPKSPRTGAEDIDAVSEERRQALIGIIQFLHDEPEKTLPTFLALSTGQIKLAPAAQGTWVDAYNCVGRFPKYWKAQLLCKSSGGTLTAQQLNAINSHDASAISTLFDLAAQVTDGLLYPSSLLGKGLSSQIFLQRLSDLGDRIKKLASSGAVSANGAIDCARFAAYTIVWADDQVAKEVVHIDGQKAALPASLRVTPQFSLQAPCHELSSSLVEGQCKLHIAGLFAAGQGPHKHQPPAKAKRGSKNTDSCIFLAIDARLKAMPEELRPDPILPDPKFLAASDAAAREKKRRRRSPACWRTAGS